jgi:hypothetical protein
LKTGARYQRSRTERVETGGIKKFISQESLCLLQPAFQWVTSYTSIGPADDDGRWLSLNLLAAEIGVTSWVPLSALTLCFDPYWLGLRELS